MLGSHFKHSPNKEKPRYSEEEITLYKAKLKVQATELKKKNSTDHKKGLCSKKFFFLFERFFRSENYTEA